MSHMELELFPIEQAAATLNTSVEAVLELGVEGKIPVFAPVLNAGDYQWPDETDAIAFPEVEIPFRASFGSQHQVVLSPDDVAAIQAHGSCVIRRFADEPTARLAVHDAHITYDPQPNSLPWYVGVRTESGVGVVSATTWKHVETLDIQDFAYAGLWRRCEGEWDEIPTELRHLFIPGWALNEYARSLREDQGLGVAASLHGNTLENAKIREEVFAAALFLLSKSPKRYGSAATLAEGLRQRSSEFWPEEQDIPMSEKAIRVHLSAVLKTGRISRRKASVQSSHLGGRLGFVATPPT